MHRLSVVRLVREPGVAPHRRHARGLLGQRRRAPVQAAPALVQRGRGGGRGVGQGHGAGFGGFGRHTPTACSPGCALVPPLRPPHARTHTCTHQSAGCPDGRNSLSSSVESRSSTTATRREAMVSRMKRTPSTCGAAQRSASTAQQAGAGGGSGGQGRMQVLTGWLASHRSTAAGRGGEAAGRGGEQALHTCSSPESQTQQRARHPSVPPHAAPAPGRSRCGPDAGLPAEPAPSRPPRSRLRGESGPRRWRCRSKRQRASPPDRAC